MRRYLIVLIFLLINISARAADIFFNPVDTRPGNGPVMNNPERGWYLIQKIQSSYSDSLWVDNIKRLYYYHPEQPSFIDSVEIFQYDQVSTTWILRNTIVATYDPVSENISEIIWYSFYGTDIRVPGQRILLEYNDNHYLLNWAFQHKDTLTGNWIVGQRMHFVYVNNNVSALVTWYDGVPTPYDQKIFNTDLQGRIIQETWQTSSDSTNWTDYKQVFRTFHPLDTSTGTSFMTSYAQLGYVIITDSPMDLGMWSEELTKSWINDIMDNESKATYDYDISNKLVSELYQKWINFSWNNESKFTYDYDNNGNLIHEIYQRWNTMNWDYSSRDTNTWEYTTANDDHTTPAINGLSLFILSQSLPF